MVALPQLTQIGSRFQSLRREPELELADEAMLKRRPLDRRSRVFGKHTRAVAIRISTAEGATLDRLL
jgi:hypothetical protein